MRVIGGKLRGKLIHNPTDKTTRPLKDMVRESIFNILEHSKNEKIKFKNDVVLDLFSGSGSFGIECLSRGVKKVFFFENYKPSLKVLEKNIQELKIDKASESGILPEIWFKKKYKLNNVDINIDIKNKILTGLVNLFIVLLKDLNRINMKIVIPKGDIGRRIDRFIWSSIKLKLKNIVSS